MKKLLRLSIILVVTSFIANCASNAPPDLTEIQAFTATSAPKGINSIRLEALQETATSLGARAALAWRAQQIDYMLNYETDYLNQVFNFQALLLNNNVLPPVLDEATNSLNLASNDAIRTATRIYKIVTPPRFVTAAPSWRDYLWLGFQKPSKPNDTLLPKNAAERAIWNEYIQIGWQQGIEQANQIYSVNLGRLKRDFRGMVLYRILLAQHIVSSPFVATTDLGITGDGNQLRINDQALRITATSQLNPNSSEWQPIIVNNPTRTQLPQPQ